MIRRRLKVTAVGTLLVLGGLTATAAEPTDTSESARLNAWFEEQFQWELERSPVFKTYLGIVDQDYDEWDDASPRFEQETFEIGQRRLAEMKERFDFDALDDAAKLSWQLFEYEAERREAGYPYRDHEYTFNQMFGVQSEIPAFLINQHQISEPAHAEAYIDRLQSADEYLRQEIDNARRSFDKHIFPPRFVYAHVVRDARNVISGAPFDENADSDSPLWADFKAKLDALDIEEQAKAGYLERARLALQNHLAPAYRALIDEMQRQRDSATDEAGVWKLPDGENYYRYRLEESTTTDMSAEEIHRLGLRETARIHDEMREIMTKVGFDGDLQAFFEFMRTDEQFYYPNTDEGRERYLREATERIDTMKGRLDELFLTRPEADLTVKRVEPFREQSAGTAFYQRPAPDGSRPGIYYANLRDMSTMPIYQMEALAYHEGIPGHHMQLSIAQELDELPAFRRFGGYTAHIEGWGLYAEWLAKEMGFYSDPYSDFGRLAMELWRAGRLVVDTGLHHKRWTREQAIAWLGENTPDAEDEVVKAIERYIVMPGQATAYAVGMLKMRELREKASRALGDAFDVRDFHDVVIGHGSVPLEVLETLVDEYIADQRG